MLINFLDHVLFDERDNLVAAQIHNGVRAAGSDIFWRLNGADQLSLVVYASRYLSN
jgi:hypothetical protein